MQREENHDTGGAFPCASAAPSSTEVPPTPPRLFVVESFSAAGYQQSKSPEKSCEEEGLAKGLTAAAALHICGESISATKALPKKHVLSVSFLRTSQARLCLRALAAEREPHAEQHQTDFLIGSKTTKTAEGASDPRWCRWADVVDAPAESLLPRVAVVLQSGEASLLQKKITFFKNSLRLVARLVEAFDTSAEVCLDGLAQLKA